MKVPSGYRAVGLNTAEGAYAVTVSVGQNNMDLHAVNGDGISAGTDETAYKSGIEVSTPMPPDSPTDLVAVSGDGQVTLNWTAPEYNGGYAITSYKIYYDTTAPSADDATSDTYVEVSADTTTATISGLTNNTDYYFWVKAVNFVGESASDKDDAVPCAPLSGGPVTEVSSAVQLEVALQNEEVTEIHVVGSFTYEDSILAEKDIVVKSGNTLTLSYSTEFSFPYGATTCNANITVEDGAGIVFHDTCWWVTMWKNPALHSYMIVNGDVVLNEGSRVSASRAQNVSTSGYLLFRGNFVNNGSFDMENVEVYLNYGETAGTFTNGTPKYNLCITQPTTLQAPVQSTDINNLKISLTGIQGEAYAGGQLYTVVDGFGAVKEDGLFPVVWNNETQSAAVYTVPDSAAGTSVSAELNGTLEAQYGYFFVVDTEDGPMAYDITAFDTTEQSIEIAKFVVRFDANGGTCDTTVLVPDEDGKLSSLPTPTRSGYTFLGWCTEDGTQVGEDTVFTQDTTLTAQWQYNAPPANPNYKITIEDTEHGTVTAPTSAKQGTEVTLTPTPDEGFDVGTVTVTDRFGDAVEVTENPDGTYTFTMPNGQVTVEVTFVESQPEPLPFTDVAESDWFYDAVRYAYENGLMGGIGDNLFAPNHPTTRAQLVTILYRLEGEPAVTGQSPFTDVEADTWYTDAVIWAAEEGVVNGVSETQFAPGNNITREQLATILFRYAQAKGYDVSPRADLSGFPDAGDILPYAQEAMAWAVAEGLLQGFEDDTLRPQGNATRAQIATILMRFCQTVVE